MWTKKRSAFDRLGAFFSGVGVGAGLLWSLNPRRRARARDRAVHLVHEMGDAVDTTRRDVAHRAGGLVAEARSALRREAVTDDVLVARVRSHMGRVVSHPRAIEVAAHDGRVTLSGPILAHELRPLMRCVWRVHGVRDVENRLESFRSDARPQRL